ncbi:MAG: hypothetical protein L6Q99_15370 [Planctomycetes bacterium]|nr:hypothetical protein [Planctomycetota bacterium]
MFVRTQLSKTMPAIRRSHVLVLMVALAACATLGLRRVVAAGSAADPLVGAGTEAGAEPGVEPGAEPAGLEELDREWLNVAGEADQDWPAGWDPAPRGCHWFGGYPTNPFAGVWQRIESGEITGAR